MPNYPGTAQATLLYENTQKFLWQNEAVSTGTLSIAYELRRILGFAYPWGLSFEVIFSGTPGAFEIDLMAANNDIAANYVQIGNITVVNSTNVGRFDMPLNIWPKYIAGYVKTLTNAVTTTLQVTR